ncbi:IS110 family transposase [Polaribacter batillariae]|uniref:IS110 family transposase n=1 Tax=Polaribacter batillariae TaxID=2808900 RepID=A0ABX7SXI3_9FLAO|nr:IS110 family transposase [Polaribacter batillariae]QTD36449.1 IS110 family transposase [Polaribacter batillariae]QTD37700.1 IS110 family transposase [Polaribacter batillariae]QTD38211.1 IS110 family transposase [Polaribacter batillariae]QTD38776.1 IS110 family transposase [Polaribacter batillariae]
MNKDIKYFGIDISHLFFDVTDSDGNYYQFKNNLTGFKKFVKLLDLKSHCVMEATGYYHYQLAYYLQEKGFKLSVENPLSVKRFIQMKLSKIKTDKSDSKLICEYAKQVKLKLWKGNSKHQLECLQMTRTLSAYTKQSTMLKNKLHGEAVLGTPSKSVVRSLKRSLKHVEKEIKTIEEDLLILVKEVHNDVLTRLKSIPGIGPKTSLMLVVLTDGFERFTSGSELCSYAGLTPTIRQSGSSVKGRSRISKIGNQKLRNLLFMCSFNACKYNKACRDLYQRIVAKGKSKKLALIAVCNKLLKQVFAIAKSGLIYDENYKSTFVKN